jgi:HK97 family phage prohead protease
MNEFMLYKDLTVEAIEDVDQIKGIVTGYFSVFGNKDSDGDIIAPKAYRKTLKENGPESEHPRILHLFQHDPYKVLAKPSELFEDKKGLRFVSQISQTTLGKDVLQLYMDKVLTEHSIGYQIIKSERDEKQEANILTELKLWEGSTVSWGANMEAIVESVKSENVTKALWDKLLQRLDAFETAVKGNYTDDTARQLEISHNQVKQLIISLARKSEPIITPETKEPKFDVTADWILSKLNIKL